jgi:hypothetical protein
MNGNRNAFKIKILPHFVFNKSAIRLLNILRKVGKKSKVRSVILKLGNVLDADTFSFYGRRRIPFNEGEDYFV